jgi:general secretion pathway protein K
MKDWSCKKRLSDNRGMALLITIMIISLLIAITVQFNRTVRQNYFASAAQLDGQYLRMIARSGVSFASAILESDGMSNEYDTLLESWATIDSDSFAGFFNRGTLKIELTDFSGRLQVNSLVQEGSEGQESEDEQNANENREILNRLLLSGNFEVDGETEAQEIVDSLIDWLDTDERESDFGAEESYYQSLENPYGCRNGSIVAIEELLLVKGMTPNLLFGSEDRAGLADFLTVHGTDGKININTAPVEILQAMHPLMTDEIARNLDEYRAEEGNAASLENSEWYKSVPGWPGDIVLPEKSLSTVSSYFQLISEGQFHDQRRRLTAVLWRNSKNTVSVLYQKVE